MPDVVSDETREKRTRREPLKSNARRMRREPTPAEIKFWYQVRDRRLDGLKFKRQVPIGPFIADFVCLEHKLIVEIDGGQHADETGNDERREAYLKSAGFRVLRFWNHDVLTSIENVIDTVLVALPPHPALSPCGGEGCIVASSFFHKGK